MFSRTARYYDLIYSFKNYAAEAAKIRDLILREHPSAHSILDAACGTAEHAKMLVPEFSVDGVDIQPEFIEISRGKVPSGNFSVADMRNFHLGKKYDVVTCLFSAIGYLTRGDEVIQALECFAEHLKEDGIILIEPWFTPETWKLGTLHLLSVDLPDIKISRVGVSGRHGNLSVVPIHYLIATVNGTEHIVEDHELALHTVDEMLSFFHRARLKVEYDPEGIAGRGLYIARHNIA